MDYFLGNEKITTIQTRCNFVIIEKVIHVGGEALERQYEFGVTSGIHNLYPT